jgi:beta-glucosidase
VNGLQSRGIGASPKHLACNECELFRTESDSIVDDVTLRELYLLPFQICLKKSSPWTIMAAYNKLNGTSCTENEWLLTQLLRTEWGFEGLTMSDWDATYSQIAPITAGCNLEMPGPSIHRGSKLVENVNSGRVSIEDVDTNVKRVVELAARAGMADGSAPEKVVADPSIAAIACQVAEEGIVLLKNKNNILPIPSETEMKIAVFGAPAQNPVIHGGGSSSLAPHYIVSPIDALRSTYKNITYRYGIPIFMKIPSPSVNLMKTADGKPGIDCVWYNGWNFGERQVCREVLDRIRVLVIDPRIPDLEAKHCVRMTFTLTPETSGTHTFGITSNGETHLFVDDMEVTSHPGYSDTKVEYIMEPGHFERRGSIAMQGGKEYKIRIDALSTIAPAFPPPAFHIAPQATQVGFFENLESFTVGTCEELAKSSDVSIVFTGHNFEFESESFDRKSLSLPLGQDEFITAVAGVSKRTIVINQTGSAISMPWLGDVDAVLQNWFAGMEVGNALANLLCGKTSPSGRMPTTWPKQVEDVLSDVNFPRGQQKVVRYEEGLDVGYRALAHPGSPEPLFIFGYGLSYAEFTCSHFTLAPLASGEVGTEVSVTITNTSERAGKEVVQVYVDGVLKGFAKVHIQPLGSERVSIELGRTAFSTWDAGGKSGIGANGVWRVNAAEYKVDVRRDARTVLLGATWSVGEEKACIWEGL